MFIACSDIGPSPGPNVLVVSRKDLRHHAPIGLVSRVKLTVVEDGGYDFQVIMISKENGRFNNVEEFLAVCEKISVSGGYKFCPGFDSSLYKSTYFDHIRYDPKNLRRSTEPVSHIDSWNCSLWHKLAKNASILEKDMEDVLCDPCKRLRNNLNQRLKKVKNVPPEKKNERVKPSSNYPVKYVSPNSLGRKRKNTVRERADDKKALKKYSCMNVCLNDEQK